MGAETREAVCGAAVRAAQAVNYEGAGTIEFIADASEGLRADRIWFMEMNTRLQVEHPVTEEITGQDLVEWQLRVASGEKLPKTQDELAIDGWAMEARLYAEDPAKGFLPSVGRLAHFDLGEEGRIETGVEGGDRISPYYDPMIAKLIARGDSREEALDELSDMVAGVEVWPVRTNAAFLLACLERPQFRTGDVTTGFIAAHEAELTAAEPATDREWNAAGLQLFAPYFYHAEDATSDPWAKEMGFRLNAPERAAITIHSGGEERTIDLNAVEAVEAMVHPGLDGVLVFREGQAFEFSAVSRGTGTSHGLHDGEIEAPMPGKVTAVEVSAGEKVAKGQRLLTLEAMKMEHALTAPFDGTVAELSATAGAQVTEGQVLVRVEPTEG